MEAYRYNLSIPSACPLLCLFLMSNCELATTVDVKRVFSQGLLFLPHVQNHLSFQSTHALLCVGTWSTLGLINDSDIKAALRNEVIRVDDP